MKRLWITAVAALCLTTGLTAAAPRPAHDPQDPLLKPIAPAYSARWLGPQAPIRIHGRTYLVGFEGLSVGLIRTSEGLILIDGAVPQAVPDVEAHIRALGLRVEDVKFILSTEPHYDHSGGLAALARDSRATVVAAPEAAEALRRGMSGPEDPQQATLERFPPVERLRTIRDGETLVLGDTTVTAHASPGHTPGSMSWSWRSCEGDGCLDVVFSASLNPISADGYRFSDPARRADLRAFRATFDRFRALPCDILLTSHPSQSGGEAKLAGLRRGDTPNPFVDPTACRAYADEYEALLNARLERERTGGAD